MWLGKRTPDLSYCFFICLIEGCFPPLGIRGTFFLSLSLSVPLSSSFPLQCQFFTGKRPSFTWYRVASTACSNEPRLRARTERQNNRRTKETKGSDEMKRICVFAVLRNMDFAPRWNNIQGGMWRRRAEPDDP